MKPTPSSKVQQLKTKECSLYGFLVQSKQQKLVDMPNFGQAHNK